MGLLSQVIKKGAKVVDGLLDETAEVAAKGFDEAAWLKENPRPHADIPYSKLNESEMRDYMRWHAAKGRAKKGIGPREQIAPRNEKFSEERWLEENPHPFPDRRRKDLSPEELKTYQNWHAAKSKQKHFVEQTPQENLFDEGFDRLAWEADNPNPVPNKRQRDMSPDELKSYKSWIARRHYAGRKDKEELIKRNTEAAAARRAIDPSKSKATVARRRAARQQRSVPWSSKEKIDEIYAAATEATRETGIPHEVDHVIPLRGARVSGLHHQDNLLVVPRGDNRSKGFAFEPGDLPPRAGVRKSRAYLKKIREAKEAAKRK